MKNISKRLKIGEFPGFGSFTFLFYVYLYVPILIVVWLSFNSSSSATIWESFSLKWYAVAFENKGLRNAAWNSVQIAIISALVSTALSTLAALTITRHSKRKESMAAQTLIMLPLVMPEIVLAISMLGFFSFLGIALGKLNLIIAHTMFCIPFAYLPIRARIQDMDNSLQEAGADLYASPLNVFRRVTLPLLMPGIISGFMLAFVVSMDNFTVSVLVAQAGSTTLPIFIFGMLRMGLTPDVNAVSTIILIVSILLVTLSYFYGAKKK